MLKTGVFNTTDYIIHITNVHEMDPDVSPMGLLRFSPDAPLKKIHKLQHIYAWFFYGLMTFSWATNKEFKQLNDFKKDGVIIKKNMHH